jgi:hypothetical protein
MGSFEPVLKKAREHGIVVISHEASSQENADLIIEPFQNAEYGRRLMDHLARYMGGKGEYATFVGSLTSKSHNEWVDAAVTHQKEKYPEMVNVVSKVEDDDDQNRAYEKTKELSKTYPHLKGIQGSAMSTVPGAALAVEERGLTGQDPSRGDEFDIGFGALSQEWCGEADLLLGARWQGAWRCGATRRRADRRRLCQCREGLCALRSFALFHWREQTAAARNT